jgi:dTDP-4-dehydrorhamnose reductase
MAGHVIYQYLKDKTSFEIIGVTRNNKNKSDNIELDVSNFSILESKIKEIQPNIIINAVGILIKGSQKSPEYAILLNSYLPHLLSKLCRKYNANLIHISTDCVFSGNSGNYMENSFRDEDNIYGRSKALGEIINGYDLTIRTSIIGPELKNDGEGLFDWFMKASGEIKGFSNVYWSGVTTLQLAISIKTAIENQITGLIHLTNNNKISKYELLCMMKEVWNRINVIIQKDNSYKKDKSFINTTETKHLFNVPTYREMLLEMKKYMDLNPERYVKYQ